MPTLFLFPCDNVGAECILGTKGPRAKYPCRCCMIPKDKIHDFNTSKYAKRVISAKEVDLLAVAFRARCRELRKVQLTLSEKRALEFCKERSINPLEIQLFRLGSYLPSPPRY